MDLEIEKIKFNFKKILHRQKLNCFNQSPSVFFWSKSYQNLSESRAMKTVRIDELVYHVSRIKATSGNQIHHNFCKFVNFNAEWILDHFGCTTQVWLKDILGVRYRIAKVDQFELTWQPVRSQI